jgi:predicted ATPase
LYLLDEPEAALSPQRILSLMVLISRLLRKNSQFIIATHSPILLGIPGASILSFDAGKIHKIKYEDTESYRNNQNVYK